MNRISSNNRCGNKLGYAFRIQHFKKIRRPDEHEGYGSHLPPKMTMTRYGAFLFNTRDTSLAGYSQAGLCTPVRFFKACVGDRDDKWVVNALNE